MSSSAPENATSRSWHRLPDPAHKAELGYAGVFSRQDLERIQVGHVPTSMEDKWFIYLEDGWLRFHRSWTGACIYGLKIRATAEGGQVVESWVNRDAKQYKQNDTEHDRRLVEFLVGAFLLRTVGVAFPMTRNSDGLPKGVLQHSAVGRGYPETEAEID